MIKFEHDLLPPLQLLVKTRYVTIALMLMFALSISAFMAITLAYQQFPIGLRNGLVHSIIRFDTDIVIVLHMRYTTFILVLLICRQIVGGTSCYNRGHRFIQLIDLGFI